MWLGLNYRPGNENDDQRVPSEGNCDLETGALWCTTSKEDGEVVKEVTPAPGSDPATSRRFHLDDVQGLVCTTQKVTIPPLGTVSIHGHIGVRGHCMLVHALAKPA